ncbi:MAG: IPTL-CTERM sorting domain-containing protein [Sedimentisphaerales bacterium]|jgi:hypothetical protein
MLKMWIIVIVGCAVILFSTNIINADTRVQKFENTADNDANDLHIEFENSATIDFTAKDDDGKLLTRPFNSERVDTTAQKHNLYNGTVKKGESAQVKIITANGKNAKITGWWWTVGGNALKDGDSISHGGTPEFPNGDPAKETIFRGGNATGDGAIKVRINAADHVFTTTAGYSPEQSATAFKNFLDSLNDANFALIYSYFSSSISVKSSGTLLGNPNKELTVTLQAHDSTQSIEIFDYICPTISEWGLIIMAGLLLTVGAVVIRQRFKTVPA